ncbi:hypothetical protein LguiB_031702 [Lonicera macranthoides]
MGQEGIERIGFAFDGCLMSIISCIAGGNNIFPDLLLSQCADDYSKYLSKWVLETCHEDLAVVLEHIDKTLVDRLQLVELVLLDFNGVQLISQSVLNLINLMFAAIGLYCVWLKPLNCTCPGRLAQLYEAIENIYNLILSIIEDHIKDAPSITNEAHEA